MGLLHLLPAVAAATLLLLSGGDGVVGPRFADAQQQQANVIVIMSDQHRWDSLRFVQEILPEYRNTLMVETPNIDRLAKLGVTFTSAHTVSPSCVPSRSSFYSGFTLQRTGMSHNKLYVQHGDYPSIDERVWSYKTYEQVLVEKHNYRIEYYGKFHRPRAHFYKDSYYKEPKATVREPIYDFNAWDFRSDVWSFNFDPYTPNKGDNTRYNIEKYNVDVRFRDGMKLNQCNSKLPYYPFNIDTSGGLWDSCDRSVGIDIMPLYTQEIGIHGESSVFALQRLITKHQQDAKPFYLAINFEYPHHPIIGSEEYIKPYFNNQKSLFYSPSIDDPVVNSGYKRMNWGYPEWGVRENIQEVTSSYYALIQEIDDYVGRVIDLVYDNNLENNTMIMFTADHGEMLGAHGMRHKYKFLDESIKVPLIISMPTKIPQNVFNQEHVSHLDVAATILDYCANDPNANTMTDGQSLRGVIEGTLWNENRDDHHIFTEFDRTAPVAGPNDFALTSEPNFMLRKGRYKLMLPRRHNESIPDMMYDGVEDWMELNNLLGVNGPVAPDVIIGKAEHLRALLIEDLERFDGVKGYYSNPYYSFGIGLGDIAEIKLRRTWRPMDFWVSDRIIPFGPSVFNNGMYRRNEFVYFGRATPGTAVIESISIKGPGAAYFTVDKTTAQVGENEHGSIKVSFASNTDIAMDQIDAFLALKTNVPGYSIVKIPIGAQEPYQDRYLQ